jgi:hypothetical protein
VTKKGQPVLKVAQVSVRYAGSVADAQKAAVKYVRSNRLTSKKVNGLYPWTSVDAENVVLLRLQSFALFDVDLTGQRDQYMPKLVDAGHNAFYCVCSLMYADASSNRVHDAKFGVRVLLSAANEKAKIFLLNEQLQAATNEARNRVVATTNVQHIFFGDNTLVPLPDFEDDFKFDNAIDAFAEQQAQLSLGSAVQGVMAVGNRLLRVVFENEAGWELAQPLAKNNAGMTKKIIDFFATRLGASGHKVWMKLFPNMDATVSDVHFGTTGMKALYYLFTKEDRIVFVDASPHAPNYYKLLDSGKIVEGKTYPSETAAYRLTPIDVVRMRSVAFFSVL